MGWLPMSEAKDWMASGEARSSWWIERLLLAMEVMGPEVEMSAAMIL